MHVCLWGGVSARHTRSTWRGWPGATTGLRPPIRWTAGRDMWQVLGCGRSGRLWLVLCVWRCGTGQCRHALIFPPFTTSGPAQAAGAALAADTCHPAQEPSAELRACPPAGVLPPPAAAPAAALELGPAWAASPDPTEAPPPLAEEPWSNLPGSCHRGGAASGNGVRASARATG